MADIVLAPLNHAHMYVWCDEARERELSDEFSFLVPGAQYMQAYKRRQWDGKIRLYNRPTKTLYVGLLPRVMAWAKRRGYSVENRLPTPTSAWSHMDTEALLQQFPTPMPPRDYQRAAITHALHHQRCVILSATGSGKSLVLYYLVRARVSHGPVLLIVPTISLVSQMLSDWREYGWANVDQFVHTITGGKPKHTDKPVVISTWQSIFTQPETWFARYSTILGDECHLYKAESLRGIMEKLPDCPVRIGVTGTLDDAKSNALMVEGVFGPPHRVARTADLQEQGYLTPIKIQGHFLQYDKHDRWMLKEHKRKYAEEIEYLVSHQGRMRWLVDFCTQLTGNVLVLYTLVEKHGEPLYRAIREKVGSSRPIYFVSGSVDGEQRERVRALLEAPEHTILTFDGVDIRCASHERIPLADGRHKVAKEITPEDDVDDRWILTHSDKRGIPK